MTGEFAALDVKSGKIKWSVEFGAGAFGAPVVINDVAFVTTFDGVIHGIETKNGNEVWSETLPAGSNTAVTASGDTLLVPAGIATSESQTPELVAYRVGG